MPRARCAGITATHEAEQVIVLDFASVQVYYAGTTNPITETLFQADSGAVTKSNPFQSDADGNFVFYLDVELSVKLVITHPDTGVLTADFVPVSMAAGTGTTVLSNGSVVIGGSPGILPTTAPAPFIYITGVAGTPTGVPVNRTANSQYPLVIDSVSRRLYYHTGGAWSRFYAPGTTIFVAASDASADSKSVAGPAFTCTGTNDHIVIQAALNALPAAGGTVMLSEGTFNTSDTMSTSVSGTTLAGQGAGATRILAASNHANTTMVGLNHPVCTLRDLTVNGQRTVNSGKLSMRVLSLANIDCTVDSVIFLNSPGNGADISGNRVLFTNCDFFGHQFVALNFFGGESIIKGCQFYNNLQESLYIAGSNNTIVSNTCINNASSGITLTAPGFTNFVNGNLCRNNSGYGINNSAGSANYIGLNDTMGNGAGGINNTGTATRRVSNQILNFNLSADLGTPPGSAVPIPASVWTTIGTAQNFSPMQDTSIIRIDVRGFVMAGATGVAGSEFGSRLVIDGSPFAQLGGASLPVGSLYINALHGAGAVSVLGLSAAPAVHTVAVQVFCQQAGQMYCRPVSIPGIESFGIQMTEHSR